MKTLPRFSRCLLFVCIVIASSQLQAGNWITLFNAKNLDGWTPKIAGHPVGENTFDTFRVEDGILKAEYDGYDTFKGRFGHLYTNQPYSHYLFRLEYRFAGEMMPDAPGFANLNSGIMIHSQSPLSMGLDQSFPVSLEFQFLADEGKGSRETGNVCTPGTNLEIDGKLVKQHIVKSTAPTFPPDEWVAIEIEVRGNEEVIHRVNGKEVLRYQKPQLDPENQVESSEALRALGVPLQLSFGHIALQAEGQPVWFRNIEIKSLAE